MAHLGNRAPGHELLKQLQHVVKTAPAGPPRPGSASWLPPEAHSWHQGILGELAVARVLDTLPPGWTVFHSVPVGEKGSDIDHVAISPDGHVTTINTKHHQGASVWVGERALMVNGHRQTYIRDVRFEASRAAEKLSAAVGAPVSVRPFLVIVAARSLSVKQQPEGATVTTLTDLVRLLRRTPPGGSAALGHAVSRAASESSTWSAQPLDSTSSADLIVWFMTRRQAVVPSGNPARPVAPMDTRYRAILPSGRNRPRPAKVVVIVAGSLLGTLWAGGILLGLLASIGHG